MIEGAVLEEVAVEDVGAEITATVTASAEGYAPGSATSNAVTVDRLDTRSYGSLDKRVVLRSTPVGYDVSVTSKAGVVPSGTATIYDGSRALQTVTLGADGTARVTLTGLSRGIHLVTVKYDGTDTLADSRSRVDVLVVL